MKLLSKSVLQSLLTFLLVTSLCSCASRSYQGYKYRPYMVHGVRYHPLSPRQALSFTEYGTASHYSEGWWIFPGKTALGERFHSSAMEGAHRTLPLPCRIRVTNLRNGRSVILRINDRGPFIRGRILDVTPTAARKLGFYRSGLTRVRIRVLSVGDGRYRIR
ncbi:MAG: septal ring lytic transglycosylase RlpA family lipoprotein [Verrucomicrobia bacterium]|nr:MAG: septal ring lytic transglycosylase RlpA family lipoprotein [Verrucomicrobiota bacterium]